MCGKCIGKSNNCYQLKHILHLGIEKPKKNSETILTNTMSETLLGGLWSGGVIGPHFFENTAKSNVIVNRFVNAIVVDDVSCQRDDAACPTLRKAIAQ